MKDEEGEWPKGSICTILRYLEHFLLARKIHFSEHLFTLYRANYGTFRKKIVLTAQFFFKVRSPKIFRVINSEFKKSRNFLALTHIKNVRETESDGVTDKILMIIK